MKKALAALIKKSIPFRAGLIGFAVFIALLPVHYWGLLERAELASLDLRFRELSLPENADTNIVIVAIDQNTLDFFQNEKIGWPFPREFYAVVNDYLSACGAKAIIYDIDFSSTEIERVDVDPEISEKKFAESIAASGRTYMASILVSGTENQTIAYHPGGNVISHLADKDSRFSSVLLPLQSFGKNAAGIGFVNVFPDSDKIIRRTPFLHTSREGAWIYLPLMVYLDKNGIERKDFISKIKALPGSGANEHLINWYGEGGVNGVFKYYPFHSLVSAGYDFYAGDRKPVFEALFKDKYIFIGGAASGLYDYKPVPVGGSESFPGVEIHATVLSNLLRGDFMNQIPVYPGLIITLIISFFASYFFSRFRVTVAVVYSLSLLAGYIFVALWFFYESRYIFPVAFPAAALILSTLASGITNYSIEGRKRRDLKKLFSRYVSPHVIDELTSDPEKIMLKGREVEATVFFSDIKDFTAISEKLQPAEVVSHLNAYFKVCTEVVIKHEAMLDKYIGDAIMAIFGAPLENKNHGALACLAALEMNEMLKKFNVSNLSAGQPVFETRIGLNTGKMVIGNIGADFHLDFTAVGDAVNIASRLESANKTFGTQILISESTYLLSKDVIEAREIDHLNLKGKELPVRIYELIGKKGETEPDRLESLKVFEDGLRLYRENKMEEAEKCFLRVKKLFPGDTVAAVYLERIQNNQKKI